MIFSSLNSDYNEELRESEPGLPINVFHGLRPKTAKVFYHSGWRGSWGMLIVGELIRFLSPTKTQFRSVRLRLNAPSIHVTTPPAAALTTPTSHC